MTTLKRCKTMLAECHLESSDLFELYKDCGLEYLVDRIKEEQTKFKSNNHTNIDKLLAAKLMIQLLTLYRVKLDDQIKANDIVGGGNSLTA